MQGGRLGRPEFYLPNPAASIAAPNVVTANDGPRRIGGLESAGAVWVRRGPRASGAGELPEDVDARPELGPS